MPMPWVNAISVRSGGRFKNVPSFSGTPASTPTGARPEAAALFRFVATPRLKNLPNTPPVVYPALLGVPAIGLIAKVTPLFNVTAAPPPTPKGVTVVLVTGAAPIGLDVDSDVG